MNNNEILEIEDLIKEGIIELEIYRTTPTHCENYGLKANNPLYVQRIFIQEEHRRKGLGIEVLKHIDKFANKNNHDLIFGHISDKAKFTKDLRTSFFNDIQCIKNWLRDSGYSINEEDNDFHKVIDNNFNYETGGL